MTRLMTITALLFSIFSFANVAQGKPTNSGSPEEFIQFYFDAFNDEDEKRLEMVFLKPFSSVSGNKVTVYKSWREYINYEVVTSKLHAFIERNDALYLTIDLDGFSSAYAPGVSAPSALGFSPAFAFKILNYLMQTQKVVAVDIAELNPRYDRDQCTTKLAAQIVTAVVEGL